MTGVWACLVGGSGNGELPHGDIRDLGEGFVGLVILEVEFDGFLEHRQGFLTGRPEAGHVEVQTLGDEIRAFAVEGVVNLLHVGNVDHGLEHCKPMKLSKSGGGGRESGERRDRGPEEKLKAES